MELKAVGSMVIIKVSYTEKQGRIYVPDQAQQTGGDFWGEVISVGPDNKQDLKVGDKIFFTRHEGIKIVHEEQEYYALKSMHIQGVMV